MTRFALTEKQVRDLIAVTPPGYTPKITISFEKDGSAEKPQQINPADLVNP